MICDIVNSLSISSRTSTNLSSIGVGKMRILSSSVSYHIVLYCIVIELLCTVLHVGVIDNGVVQSTRWSIKWRMLFVSYCIIVSYYCIISYCNRIIIYRTSRWCRWLFVSYHIVSYLLAPYRTVLMTVSYHIVSYPIVL